jgi:hypothetical protein
VHAVLLWLGQALTDAVPVAHPLTVPVLEPDTLLLLLTLGEALELAERQRVGLTVPLLLREKVALAEEQWLSLLLAEGL